MSQNPQITVVIPAFNEAATLPDIVQRASTFTDKIWVVDDGSTDETPKILAKLPCRSLSLPENTGKGASLRAGLNAAITDNSDAVVTLDADDQHAPETIPNLIAEHVATGADLVIAARLKNRGAMPGLRRFGNGFADFWVGLACRRRVQDSQSGFRLYSTRLLQSLPVGAIPGNRFDFENRLLIESCQQGFPTAEIAIEASYPPAGMTSHYRPLWDTGRIVGMVAKQILSGGLSTIGSGLSRLFWFRYKEETSSVRPSSKSKKY